MKSGHVRTPETDSSTVFGRSTAQPAASNRAEKEAKHPEEASVKNTFIPQPPAAVSPDEAKFQEIYSHLKTVLLVSILCIAIVIILYYLEQQNDWVTTINTKMNNISKGWKW